MFLSKTINKFKLKESFNEYNLIKNNIYLIFIIYA